ncbi:serine/threonine-protein kinase [Streptomyces sp. NPDC051917]|uniref:serine/threonine-protein kinase n=1 Tax=Streptomyces sp. NPDC051917 TaxID=3154754 RepID=UPI00344DFAE4
MGSSPTRPTRHRRCRNDATCGDAGPAVRTRGGRAVAVKVARAEPAADPVFRERFRSEVEAARAVGGFHTAPVVDADLDGDPLWPATAYIPGPALAARSAAEGAMDEPRLRAPAAALAEALESIHSCGLVHRDLRPGNIIMAADGPRVLDFGIARAVESIRLTATGTAFGTSGFLAPEQALGHDVTGAAGMFALGAVLVAAAGGSARGEGTPMGLMYRSVHEPPDLAAVAAPLAGLVARCLAKDPAVRPTATDMLDLLTGQTPQPAPERTLYSPTPSAPAQQAVPGFGPPVPYVVPEVELAEGESRVVVNATGVVLEVAGADADFEWAEIAHVGRARRGHHLTVVVRLWDGGAYDCELNARRSARPACSPTAVSEQVLDPYMLERPLSWARTSYRCRQPGRFGRGRASWTVASGYASSGAPPPRATGRSTAGRRRDASCRTDTAHPPSGGGAG